MSGNFRVELIGNQTLELESGRAQLARLPDPQDSESGFSGVSSRMSTDISYGAEQSYADHLRSLADFAKLQPKEINGERFITQHQQKVMNVL